MSSGRTPMRAASARATSVLTTMIVMGNGTPAMPARTAL